MSRRVQSDGAAVMSRQARHTHEARPRSSGANAKKMRSASGCGSDANVPASALMCSAATSVDEMRRIAYSKAAAAREGVLMSARESAACMSRRGITAYEHRLVLTSPAAAAVLSV